ncbi:NAD(P)H-binding protein [Paenibacillus kandeliae]|uniref:NAD(P)H-binding protein n=1 Tax=Paenibacillus kandeliae TaxID=3231269 RepID=UPI003458C457
MNDNSHSISPTPQSNVTPITGHQTDTGKRRPKIALTGASGYIGHNLLEKLTEHFDVIALSRNGDDRENSEHVEWRSLDLFSLSMAEEALEGADYAVYLVHSMMPTAKLTQADFEDMDFILADHFARAARKKNIKQIVYLSGILPENEPRENLSRHLRSRLEVQQTLGSYGVPVTTIRAGLIVGPQGSSFPILVRLVERLPVMTLPSWTRTQTHAIALPDVLNALSKSIGKPALYDRSIDIGGPDVMTYKQMMERMADVLGKKRHFIDFPFLTIHLSRLWVTLVTQMPREMVYPLVESLAHPMVAHPDKMVPGISDGKIGFEESAKEALEEEQKHKEEKKEKSHSNSSSSSSKDKKEKLADVRSIQRVLLPEGKNADWAGKYYMQWLGRLAGPIIHTECHEGVHRVYVWPKKQPILELTYAPEHSNDESAIYNITGGSFARVQAEHRLGQHGRLEFSQIPGTQECVIAIHDYLPALPWFLYKYTQAKLHLWVMTLFRWHLKRMITGGETQQLQHTPGMPEATGTPRTPTTSS